MFYVDIEKGIARQMADAVLAECSVPLLSVSEIAAELDWYVMQSDSDCLLYFQLAL